jgi:hypothetical protein
MDAALLDAVIARAARPDFDRFEAQLRSSGYCARPVRLKGDIEVCEGGGRRRVWSTETEPDGILRKAAATAGKLCADRARSGIGAMPTS